ncbi:IS30 family transposase ISCfr4 [Paraconexibacter sp. AEG42_29]|uniref:IS30 family transposase ISCfr4 n=1 Tax=Paraconexibacter sp. AEG42_29 TaxID=2997339 RepID=A0AAU7AX47_9ACTN
MSPLRLSVVEREEISLKLVAGLSLAQIARDLGRAGSTISREVARNGGREGYRVTGAEWATFRRSRRPKVRKLLSNPALLLEVREGFAQCWSPQQISRALRLKYPNDLSMRVSTETIYQSLFVQGKGSLRKELAVSLRSGRVHRRAQGRKDGRGQIQGMVSISERPAEVEDRAVPGHWEGDLIVGAYGRSAIVTLVERHTRYVMLARIGKDRSSLAVCEAITGQIKQLPAHLAKTLTWDQGKEMARHAEFTIATGIDVYFCDPHSPWQRGTNENTNGLLRQYFPKGTDLAVHDQAELDRVAHQLNGRPRMTLEWRNPGETLNALLAMTA